MAEHPGARIYSFDTSSLMIVDELPEPEPVWQLIFRLIESDRLFTVGLVFEELKWNEATAVLRRLNSYRSRIVIAQAEILGPAGTLALGYPQMAKPLASRERADVWVIALAKHFGYTVVTEEKDFDDRKPRSMSYVCRKEEIPCYNLQRVCAIETEG